MSIKAVVTDLDGTLLTMKKELTEDNARALEKCHERGILVIPATGRTIVGVPEFLKALPAVRYLILTNGSRVMDLREGKTLKAHLLDQEKAADILSYVNQFHILYDAYINGRGVSETRFLDNLDDYGIEAPIQAVMRRTRFLVDNIIEYVRSSPDKIEKINNYYDDLELRARVRRKLEQDPEITVTCSLYNNLEIMNAEASKGAAVLFLAEYLGIKPEEIMVCGDSDNDSTMMLPSVKKIAMGNASDSIKAMADYVTDTNDRSGVARALEKFVFS